MHYRWMNRGDRIEAPLISHDGDLHATDWDHALNEAARLVSGSGGRAVLLSSPNASNEAMFLAKKLLADFDTAAAVRVERVAGEVPLRGVPNLALRSERAANVAGATALGYGEEYDAAAQAIAGASLVVVVDDDLAGIDRETLAKAAHVIYLGTVLPDAARGASLVLPTANTAEEDGTLVNRDRWVQCYYQAKTAPGMARPAWWVLGETLKELNRGESLFSAEEAFALMAEAESAFAGLSYPALGTRGKVLSDAAVSA